MAETVIHRIADEAHCNEFVAECGGGLIASLISRQGVRNAYYLFRKQRFVVELKELRTELFDPLIVWIRTGDERANRKPTEEVFRKFGNSRGC